MESAVNKNLQNLLGHLPPRSWGSSTSRLIKHLRGGHKNIKLDDESMNRLIT